MIRHIRAAVIITGILLITGCGKNGSDGTAGVNGLNTLVAVTAESAGANCADGGQKVISGMDTSDDSVLDASEVTSMQYVCYGQGGTDGLATLVLVSNESAGANCTYGGKKVSVGIDSNRDSVLDVSEITSNDYVCHGAAGASGSDGFNTILAVTAEAAGANCADGGQKVESGLDTSDDGVLDTGEVTSTTYVCNGAPGTNGFNTLVVVMVEAAGANCADGGQKIESGLDTSDDGVLDAGEVTSTQYVCNGAGGADGLTTLVQVTSEPAGANCANGGKKISVGTDANVNSILDVWEITSTDYVCHGAAGADGADGLNTLVAVTAEPAGANCVTGGQKIETGLDTSDDGVLDIGEVISTTYVCNGAPGGGVTWVDVTGTSQQAASNTGYMAKNESEVTITLPASATVGDVVQVTGIGSGGWMIAQNTGQTIMTKNLPGSPIAIGSAWAARDSIRDWQDIASSSDGSKLVAAEYGGQIYTSTDSGLTWTAQASGSRNWRSVASSADGSKLVAVVFGGQIYTSTDSGVSWTARDSNRGWSSVASSANGSKLVAVVSVGQIYTSTDSGVTWTARDSSRDWRSVASSADGTKLAAGMLAGPIYTSTDSGVTWTAQASGNGFWISVDSSSDGSKLVGASYSGQIYTSTDSGVTWTAQASGSRNWGSVASSSDGSKLNATDYGGQIYTSTDSGVIWDARSAGSRNWASVASSSDGSKLFAIVSGGLIYTPVPSTTVGTAGSISGGQFDALELQYIGNDTFTILSYAGDLIVQ